MASNPPGGQLFTVSAPSGAGKTSLVRSLVEGDPKLRVSVSHTTRAIRPGEVNGVNYHFVTRETFEAARDDNAFFEWAEVFGNLYGTAQSEVEDLLGQGFDVILEIDWQGARQVKERLPDCCAIFIMPPSLAALQNRLQSRGQDDSATIERRMAEAQNEMAHWPDCDYLVLNDDFDIALSELKSIVTAQRLRKVRQARSLATVLAELTGQ